MSEQHQFFSGTKVRRLNAHGVIKFFVWGVLGLLGLMFAYLIVAALTSRDPLDRLLGPAVGVVLLLVAYGLLRVQTRRMLTRLDAIARQTGLEAASTAGLLPGTANSPQVFGALAGGKLQAISMARASGGGTFTRIEASGMRAPQSVADSFAADAKADRLSVQALTFDGSLLRVEIAGVLGQERVANALIKLASHMKATA